MIALFGGKTIGKDVRITDTTCQGKALFVIAGKRAWAV
jgi:hypothetical protein